MDAFFASVEALEDTALRGIPLVVGGTSRRGVVASCSYEARFFGVRSAMPTTEARRLCPHATFLAGRYGRYKEFSDRLHEILRSYTPLVEGIALDEAFLDVSGAQTLFGEPSSIAWNIRNRVRLELGLDCSVGVASTKHVAKLASKAAKPVATRQGPADAKGVVVIEDDNAIAYLHSLPVRALWGVGPATERRLTRLGIATVAQLAAVPLEPLEHALGHAAARRLNDLAWNRDEREVTPERLAQSLGHEQTFSTDLHDINEISAQLLRLSEMTATRLRRKGLEGQTVTVKVRFGDFATVTRSLTLSRATDNTRDIFATAKRLVAQVHLDAGVRLLGVTMSSLQSASSDVAPEEVIDLREPAHIQPELFDVDAWADNDGLDLVIDEINDRFGDGAVARARLVQFDDIASMETGVRQWGPNG